MGPSFTYHPPEGEECQTFVKHGLRLWAEPAVGYCSRQPRPSPMWSSVKKNPGTRFRPTNYYNKRLAHSSSKGQPGAPHRHCC